MGFGVGVPTRRTYWVGFFDFPGGSRKWTKSTKIIFGIIFGTPFLNSVHSNPKIVICGSKYRGGVSYLGPVVPPYGHFRTGYSVIPENPMVTGLKDKHGWTQAKLKKSSLEVVEATSSRL